MIEIIITYLIVWCAVIILINHIKEDNRRINNNKFVLIISILFLIIVWLPLWLYNLYSDNK